MAGIIDFLLGDKVQVWTQGTFAFQTPLGRIPIAGAVAVLILVVLILYRRTTARTTPWLKTVLILLRSAAGHPGHGAIPFTRRGRNGYSIW